MLPPGPLPIAAGAMTVAASSVRPHGMFSTVDALTVVATVGVIAVSVEAPVTVTVSVTLATASFTFTGRVSAIFRPTVCLTVAKPWSSNVTV